jgi:hypothetical protein
VKRIVFCIGLGLLCALDAGWSITGRGERAMKSTVFATELPPIDRAIPSKLETATFAFG